MRDGHAEDGHDRVADELLDRAAVALDGAAGGGEVAVEHAPQRLGVERLRELGRLDEVGEKDRDRLAPLLDHERSGERRLERGVLTEDRLLELAQLCPRLEPQLLVERAPSVAIGLERVSLPASAVEGEHELCARALVEGMLGDRRLQLGDELGVVAQLELGVDEIRLGGRAQLLQPRHLEPGEGLVSEVGERRAAPEPDGLAQLRRTDVRVLSPSVGDEPLEATEVRLLGRCFEHVAGLAGDDHVRAERLAELRDVVLKRVLGRRRRLSGPELLDQLIGGNDLARPQQQQGEQRALLLARQRHRARRRRAPPAGRASGCRACAGCNTLPAGFQAALPAC